MKTCLGLVFILIFGSVYAVSQDTIPAAITPNNNTGDLPYSTQIGTAAEHVELSTGNLIVNIPFISLPGRKMSFDFGVRYDASFWLTEVRGGVFQFNVEQRNWLTPTTLGWTTNQPYLTYTNGIVLCETDQDAAPGVSPFANYGGGFNNGYTYTDAAGNKHASSVNHQWSGACPLGTWDILNFNSPDTSLSGLWHQLTGLNDPVGTILGPSGESFIGGLLSVQDQSESGASYLEAMFNESDTRGNQQILAPGSTDSAGRVPITQTTSGNQITYKIKDSLGGDQSYIVNLTSVANITTAFNINGVHEAQVSRQLISSVVLPNNQAYSFTYDGGGALQFAEITHLVLPTGATVDYQWGPGHIDCFTNGSYGRSVTRRTVTNGSLQSVWDIQYGCDNTSPTMPVPTVTVTNPADPNGVRSQVVYRYDPWQKITSIEYWTAAGGNLIKRLNMEYGGNSVPTAFDTAPQLKAIRTSVSVPGGTVVSRREFDYDTLAFMYDNQDCSSNQNSPVDCQNAFRAEGTTHVANPSPWPVSLSNVTAIREYDWGSGTPGSLLKQTIRRYAYQDNSAYSFSTNTTGGGTLPRIYKNIIDRVSVEDIYDGSALCTGNGYLDQNGLFTPPPTCQATKLAETRVTYDNGVPASYGYFGEPTAVSHWAGGASYLTTNYGYDSHGNVTAATDAKRHTTTVSYADAWPTGSSACQPAQASFAYPTTVTNALNQQTKLTYYPCTGLKQAIQDPNDLAAGRPGTTNLYDLMNRSTDTFFPDGGHTQTIYNDSSNTVESKVFLTGSSFVDKLTYIDGLGRPKQTQLLSDPQGTDYVDTTYDRLGRVYTVSNPYRSTSDPTYGVTTYSYDALNRKTLEIESDRVSQLQWSYSGNLTTSIDENLNSWVRTADALGRLTKVVEPGSLTTTYQYNVFGDLTCADQWETGTIGQPCTSSRPRSFSYDSLSRLTSARNPETGATSYSYLNGGGLCAGEVSLPCSKTDARGLTTSYSYDALNRLTARDYTNDPNKTPSTCFLYDANDGNTPANAIGRLTAEWTQNATCPGNATSLPASGFMTAKIATSYDAMGRLLTQQTCVLTNCTQNSYRPQLFTHDLAGNLTGFSDGWGLQSFTQSYDAAGRLQFLTSSWSDPTHPPTLYGVQNYGPIGLVNATMGNGLTITKSYDSRERVTKTTVQGVHQ
jgi:YD repeat-containing protein